jgi:hypothetical protein
MSAVEATTKQRLSSVQLCEIVLAGFVERLQSVTTAN